MARTPSKGSEKSGLQTKLGRSLEHEELYSTEVPSFAGDCAAATAMRPSEDVELPSHEAYHSATQNSDVENPVAMLPSQEATRMSGRIT